MTRMLGKTWKREQGRETSIYNINDSNSKLWRRIILNGELFMKCYEKPIRRSAISSTYFLQVSLKCRSNVRLAQDGGCNNTRAMRIITQKDLRICISILRKKKKIMLDNCYKYKFKFDKFYMVHIRLWIFIMKNKINNFIIN